MAGKRKRRIGYDGCGTDFVVFAILGALACWGIGHWNGLARRPFGWGRIPVPSPVRTIERMIGYTRHHGRTTPPAATPSPTATPAAATASPPPSVAPTPATAVPAATPSAAPTPDLWATPSAGATPPAAVVPTPVPVQVAAAITVVKADVHTSPDPLSAGATIVAERGTTLYSGLSDGGVTIRDTTASGKGGTVVRPAGASGAVAALYAGDNGSVWWIAGGGSARHIFMYSPQTKQARTVDLSPLGPGAGAPTNLAVVAGPGKNQTLVVSTAGSAPLLLDTATGAQREATTVFPTDIAAALTRPATTTFVSERGADGRQTLVTLSGDGVAPGAPPAVSLWTGDGWGWHARPFDAASASLPACNTLRLDEPSGAGVSVRPDGVALLAHASGGQTLASARIAAIDLAGSGSATPHALQTLPDGVFGLWAASDCIARGASGVWWSFGGTVFHTAKTDGSDGTESFLPWNGAGDEKHGHVSAICADASGAWVATDTGVHHIVPGHPDPSIGYGGYLRAALGSDAARVPSAPAPQKLNTIASQWSGVPYKWGGNDKTGVDCSGYVYALFQGVGITVPRATNELASTSEGKRIRDDLHFGDVLVFPGHCAMYLGNGWTTEALHPTVGKAAIWSRRSVIVKRFLK